MHYNNYFFFRMLSYWQTSPSKSLHLFSETNYILVSWRWKVIICLYFKILTIIFLNFTDNHISYSYIFFPPIASIWVCLIGHPLSGSLQFRGALCISLNDRSLPLCPNTIHAVYPSEIEDILYLNWSAGFCLPVSVWLCDWLFLHLSTASFLICKLLLNLLEPDQVPSTLPDYRHIQSRLNEESQEKTSSVFIFMHVLDLLTLKESSRFNTI